MKSFKFYMGVKLNMVREGDETTPYMRTNPHFISFQDFVRCDVYNDLSRQEQDVDNTVVGSGFTFTKIIFLDIHILKADPLQASSYIDLPKEINLRKRLLIFKTKIINVFYGLFLLTYILHNGILKGLNIIRNTRIH